MEPVVLVRLLGVVGTVVHQVVLVEPLNRNRREGLRFLSNDRRCAAGEIKEGIAAVGLRSAVGISGRGGREGRGRNEPALLELLEILDAVVGFEDLGDGLERRRRQRRRRVGRVAVDQAQTVEHECRLHRGTDNASNLRQGVNHKPLTLFRMN